MTIEKTIILRQSGGVEESLELFIGSGNESEIHKISMEQQLTWLLLIANNVRNSRKRNV